MDKGVFLIAFGKRGYAYLAYNLLISIRHFNKTLPVTLCCDETVKYFLGKDISLFTNVVILPTEVYTSGGKIDPGKAKVHIYDFLPYKYNLYLDVDALAFKDIEPLLDELISKDKFYLTDVVDKGGRNDDINYNYWATNAVEWEFFKLNDDSIFQTIQSSYCFIRKDKEAKNFFKKVKNNFLSFPKEKLKNLWGMTIPDELIFSGTLAQIGHDADSKLAVKPIFFGHSHSNLMDHQLIDKHYLLSVYGNGDSPAARASRTLTKMRYFELYDRLMERKYLRALGQAHRYKISAIMQDKHANIVK